MKRLGGVLGILMMVGWAAPGCSESAPPGPAPAPVAAAAPAPLELTGDREGVVYRYVDPGTGEVATASAIGDIPAPVRAQVVVFDTNAPPPAGWDLVVDLSAGLPATAKPRASFAFAVASRSAASARDEHASREVVMFSTEGCGYCRQARRFFKQHRVPYTELDVEADPRAKGRLATLGKRAGVPASQLQGVPIIFVDDQVMLGWDEARLRRLLHI